LIQPLTSGNIDMLTKLFEVTAFRWSLHVSSFPGADIPKGIDYEHHAVLPG